MTTILFVCTGNSCRSPMAEGILKNLLRKKYDFKIMSAGTAALEGLSASPHAVEALKKRGIDISGHISRSISEDMIQKSYLVIVMAEEHKKSIIKKYPDAAHKVHLLKEYDENGADSGSMDVADPVTQPEHAYDTCINEMQNSLSNLAIRLIKGEI
ncbi:MAG: low molecular weight protein arginine phosphatase [Candidatus Ancaeobacter aquaticus]|nr:low molecular weight protein arginine phosphatase [Candidatus Ancaeobacter aquaticus]